MAKINKNIRWYQPNDPYYYEVDNLPLTDLLNNDTILEDRLEDLESDFIDMGDNVPSGSVSFGALKDLKAFTADTEADKNGKVFVQPGKFTARMPMPADLESGWRMIGDDARDFNNAKGESTNSLSSDAAKSKMVSRTAVVELKADKDGYPQGIKIPSFDSTDFNFSTPPSYRLDLVFVRAKVSYDRNGSEEVQTDIGVLTGAGYRTDSNATQDQLSGKRFPDYPDTNKGRMTGMAESEIENILPGFGSVPVPEDLINYEFKNDGIVNMDGRQFAQKQLDQEASFCLPIAYVKVPVGHNALSLLHEDNLIDIRPFLRTAELTYGERAALSRSANPNGSNPFVTSSQLTSLSDDITSDLTALEVRVTVLEGQITPLLALEDYIKNNATQNVGNIESRIEVLEGITSSGGGTVADETKFAGNLKVLHGSNTNWNVNVSKTFTLDTIPPADRANTAFVYIRACSVRSAGNGSHSYLHLKANSGAFWPQVNNPQMQLWQSVKQDDIVSENAGDWLVPVTYDNAADTCSVSFQVTGNMMVFEYGELIFTGMYIVKRLI